MGGGGEEALEALQSAGEGNHLHSEQCLWEWEKVAAHKSPTLPARTERTDTEVCFQPA